MTKARSRLVALGALLASLLAPLAAAQPKASPSSERPEPANPGANGQQESDQGTEPMSPDNPHYASGYLAIGEDYYEGRSSKAELEARVAEMHRNGASRRKDHAEGLKELWGGRVLNHAGAREDLRLHARREAYLYRALFLAHTDPSVKDRKSLVDRIQGIIDREDQRHENVMQGFKAEFTGESPAAAASSARPAPSAPTSPRAGGK